MLAAPSFSMYSSTISWNVPFVRSTNARYSFAPGMAPALMFMIGLRINDNFLQPTPRNV